MVHDTATGWMQPKDEPPQPGARVQAPAHPGYPGAPPTFPPPPPPPPPRGRRRHPPPLPAALPRWRLWVKCSAGMGTAGDKKLRVRTTRANGTTVIYFSRAQSDDLSRGFLSRTFTFGVR